MYAAVPVPRSSTIPWWVILLQGIAALILGLLLLTEPGATTVAIVQVLGMYWLITGIFSVVSLFVDHDLWGWKLLSGIIGVLAGLFVLQHPLWSALLIPTTLVIVLGVQGLIIGAIHLFMAVKLSSWGLGILGALNLVLGLVLLGSPISAALALPFVYGVFAIGGGIASIFMAFRDR